jgi:hypothetical protein
VGAGGTRGGREFGGAGSRRGRPQVRNGLNTSALPPCHPPAHTRTAQLDWRPVLPRIGLPLLNLVGRRSRVFPWQGCEAVGKLAPHAHTVRQHAERQEAAPSAKRQLPRGGAGACSPVLEGTWCPA